MDNSHLNARHVTDNADSMGSYGNGDQAQSAHGSQLHNNYNEYAVDPSLSAASNLSWQQNSIDPYNHQNVYDTQQHQLQPQYGHHYGQTPNQTQRFDYGQNQQHSPYPTHYASLYGQSLQGSNNSPAPYSNQYGSAVNTSAVINGNELSHPYPNFSDGVGGLSYQSQPQASRSATISPNELSQNQTAQSHAPQFLSNGAKSNGSVPEFAQSWSGQMPSQTANVPSAKQNGLASLPASANERRQPSTSSASTPQGVSSVPSPTAQTLPVPSVTGASSSKGGLRVTHPELLEQARNNSSMKVADAPFLIVDPEPFPIEDKLAFRPTPTGHLKTNRSGKELVPGLVDRIIATSKSRGQRPKRPKSESSTPSRRQIKALKAQSSNEPQSSDTSDDDSSSDDSSDYSSDYSDDEMLGDFRPLDQVRSKPRPTDPVEAARYDAFTILYCPTGRRPAPEEMQKAGAEYPALIAKLRENLNKINADIQAAQALKPSASVSKLKAEQKKREEAIIMALRVAIDCHDDMRDTLLSGKLMAACSNMLRGCIKVGDYFGDLPVSILELLSRLRFSAKNPKLMTDLKIDAIAKKFYKSVAEQGENTSTKQMKEKVKDLLDFVTGVKEYQPGVEPSRILYHSDERHDLPKLEPSPIPIVVPVPPAAKAKPEATQTKPSGSSTLKRPHDNDSVADASNKRAALNPETKPGTAKSALPATANPSSFFSRSSNPVPRPVAKPVSTTATSAAAPPVKKPAPKPTPPATLGPSMLSGLLASIEQPKQQQKAPEAPARKAETPEEKKKRERKEKRKHLRVRFKEGSALEEVRLFTHEKAEEEGRMDVMLRDAHDDRSEGMKLKERINVDDMMDEDEVPEYRLVTNTGTAPYPQLKGIDYSAFSTELIKKEPVTKGGLITAQGLKPHNPTPEQMAQEQRETTELMAVYSDVRDIPNSPREPLLEEFTGSQPAKYLSTSDPVLSTRLEKYRNYGPDAGRQALIQEAKARNAQSSRVVMAEEGVSAVINALKVMAAKNRVSHSDKFVAQAINAAEKVQKQVDAIIDAKSPEELVWRGRRLAIAPDVYIPRRMDPQGMARVYKAIASVADEQYPAPKAPSWMPPGLKADYERYLLSANNQAKEVTKEVVKPNSEPDQAALLRQYQEIMAANGQAPAGFPPVPPPNVDPSQLAALLAGGFGQAPPPATQQAPPQWGSFGAVPPPVNAAEHNSYANGPYNPYTPPAGDRPQSQWNGYGAPMPPMGQYSGQNQSPSAYGQPPWNATSDGSNGYGGQPAWNNNNGQSNWGGHNNNDSYNNDRHNSFDNGNDHKKKNKGNKKKGHNDGFQRDPNYKRGTKPCMFFKEGNCKHGDGCTFIHER